MKILPISDLHLEFLARNEFPVPIAGDLFPTNKKILHEWVASYLKELSIKYPYIIYVLGNHEFYGGDFYLTQSKVLEFFNKYNLSTNVTLLTSDNCPEIEDYIFLGDTLWTNCNNDDPITKLIISDGMNDYRVIRNDKLGYRRLKPDDTYEKHKKQLANFDRNLKLFKGKKIIMVTHHAPSFQSVNEEYKTDYHMNGGFVSNLDEFIINHPQIKLWIHGHTHNSFNYDIGSTKVICNPMGYPKRANLRTVFENKEFNPNLVLEI